MSVIAIIAALVIEQWRPLGERTGVSAALAAYATWLERSFKGGAREHGLTAGLVGVLPPLVVSVLLHALFSAAGWIFALAFDIAVLYLTLGFRQFSHYFTDIQLAIKAGDVDRARALLEQWRGASGVVRTREEVVRLSIEEALVAAHRHVFGVLLWYLILPGPSGAILYRLAAYLAAR
jgi:cobalamin biosynthesis protein CobD/CbiB